MIRLQPLVSMSVVVAAFGCSDIPRDECLENAVTEQATVELTTHDWRTEVDSIVTTSPSDSILNIIVFVEVNSRATFLAWAEVNEVPVTYAFYGFSAYVITPRVGNLPSLKDVNGVTGIDWGVGSIGPLCL